MRTVDPITQVEKLGRYPPLLPMVMTHASMAERFGLCSHIPKLRNRVPEWQKIDLSKEERKLPCEARQELRRYKWTLKKMWEEV
jgi:hypothetical protein